MERHGLPSAIVNEDMEESYLDYLAFSYKGAKLVLGLIVVALFLIVYYLMLLFLIPVGFSDLGNFSNLLTYKDRTHTCTF